MASRRPRKATPVAAPEPAPRRDELITALRERIWQLEGIVANRKAQIADAIEALVSPDIRGGDEGRINQALGILEEDHG